MAQLWWINQQWNCDGDSTVRWCVSRLITVCIWCTANEQLEQWPAMLSAGHLAQLSPHEYKHATGPGVSSCSARPDISSPVLMLYLFIPVLQSLATPKSCSLAVSVYFQVKQCITIEDMQNKSWKQMYSLVLVTFRDLVCDHGASTLLVKMQI